MDLGWLIWQWIVERAEYTLTSYLFFLLSLFLFGLALPTLVNCISFIAMISQPGDETKHSECFLNCVESLKCRFLLLQFFVYPKISVSPKCAFVLPYGVKCPSKEEFGFPICFPLLQVIKPTGRQGYRQAFDNSLLSPSLAYSKRISRGVEIRALNYSALQDLKDCCLRGGIPWIKHSFCFIIVNNASGDALKCVHRFLNFLWVF